MRSTIPLSILGTCFVLATISMSAATTEDRAVAKQDQYNAPSSKSLYSRLPFRASTKVDRLDSMTGVRTGSRAEDGSDVEHHLLDIGFSLDGERVILTDYVAFTETGELVKYRKDVAGAVPLETLSEVYEHLSFWIILTDAKKSTDPYEVLNDQWPYPGESAPQRIRPLLHVPIQDDGSVELPLLVEAYADEMSFSTDESGRLAVDHMMLYAVGPHLPDLAFEVSSAGFACRWYKKWFCSHAFCTQTCGVYPNCEDCSGFGFCYEDFWFHCPRDAACPAKHTCLSNVSTIGITGGTGGGSGSFGITCTCLYTGP